MNFKKRFCSRTCIAKHACIARSKQLVDGKSHYKNNKTSHKSFRNKHLSAASNKVKQKYHHSFAAQRKYGDAKQKTFIKTTLKKRKLARLMDEVISDFRTFNWNNYLTQTKSEALGPNEFGLITGKIPYPLFENPFKVGYYLEAVDPMHQSLICLVSVAQVEGFRMRLHFEGYLEPFDFWVNADSPLIFPCGFCENTGRTLSAPEGWDKTKQFDTANAFKNRNFTNKTNFLIGDKLEAVSKKSYDLVCVATVADIIGNYLLIHFDDWEKDYDYWTNSSSPFIHPIGWSKENKKLLTPPPTQDPNNTFIWKEYLVKTNSVAADVSCFAPSFETFKENTKIEVVDQRNPMLIRVATIVEIASVRIKVHFDGWNNFFDDWVDVDSLDIHPINWCSKTGFPLHPPVNCKMIYKKPCPTIGCSGLGHTNSYKKIKYHKKHYTEHGCPYTKKNMQKQNVFDRFLIKAEKDTVESPKHLKLFERNIGLSPIHQKRSNQHEKNGKNKVRKSNVCQTLAAEESSNVGIQSLSEENSLQDHLFGATFQKSQEMGSELLKQHLVRSSLLSSLAGLHLPYCWDQIVKQLPGVTGINSNQVLKWNAEKVAFFVKTLTGKDEYQDAFERDEIDGESFLLLTQSDIIKTLNIKLGPAVKIYNAILLFKVLSEIEKKSKHNSFA